MVFLLWDIGKQYSPGCDTVERIPSGAILIYSIYLQKFHQKMKFNIEIKLIIADVLAIVLTDVLIFLQESNQKYTFYSQDNKVTLLHLHIMYH